MSYRRAKALDQFVEQIDAEYPDRDKRSDGWIGDAAHKSRTSDHNPWIEIVENKKKIGIVSGQDIDRDLSKTEKVGTVVDVLVANKDVRVKYIIWNSRMISSYPANGYRAWQWRPYSGKNSHKEHVHISVREFPKYFDDKSPWDLTIGPDTEPQPKPEPFVEDSYIVQRGDSLSKIAKSFKTTVAALKTLNGLTSDLIQIGKVLKVRSGN